MPVKIVEFPFTEEYALRCTNTLKQLSNGSLICGLTGKHTCKRAKEIDPLLEEALRQYREHMYGYAQFPKRYGSPGFGGIFTA